MLRTDHTRPLHLELELGASDLNADQVYAGQATEIWPWEITNGDRWALSGRLGEHPVNPISEQFGAQAFGTDSGVGGIAVQDHATSTEDGEGYLDANTESLFNVAFATTGQGDKVSEYVRPE